MHLPMRNACTHVRPVRGTHLERHEGEGKEEGKEEGRERKEGALGVEGWGAVGGGKVLPPLTPRPAWLPPPPPARSRFGRAGSATLPRCEGLCPS